MNDNNFVFSDKTYQLNIMGRDENGKPVGFNCNFPIDIDEILNLTEKLTECKITGTDVYYNSLQMKNIEAKNGSFNKDDLILLSHEWISAFFIVNRLDGVNRDNINKVKDDLMFETLLAFATNVKELNVSAFSSATSFTEYNKNHYEKRCTRYSRLDNGIIIGYSPPEEKLNIISIDGKKYFVISKRDKDMLLMNTATNNLYIGMDFDDAAGRFDELRDCGYGELALATATYDFLEDGNIPDVLAEKIFDEFSYQDKFNCMMGLEVPNYRNLDWKYKEALYKEFMSNDEFTSLMPVSKIERLEKLTGIDINANKRTAANRLFIDMDGTLCEYNEVTNIESLYNKGYFSNLKPLENVVANVKRYIAENPDTDVFVLSSVLMDSETALAEKKEWLQKYLPEIESSNQIFVPYGESKADFIIDGIKEGDMLLDDFSHNLKDWQEKGGSAIKLMNGINGTKGTWRGKKIDKDCSFEDFKATFFYEKNQELNVSRYKGNVL